MPTIAETRGTDVEAAMAPEARHALGAHYTPEPIVRRTLGPLVFDELWDACAAAADRRGLEALHDRLASLIRSRLNRPKL